MDGEVLTPLGRVRWAVHKDGRRVLQQAHRKDVVQDGTRTQSLVWLKVPDGDVVLPDKVS